MLKKMSFVVASAALLSACSGTNDYTPPADASALDIHNSACISCHAPVEVDGKKYFWELAPEKVNADFIKMKIANGSLMMPAHPNIKGEQLDSLVQFIMGNNKSH